MGLNSGHLKGKSWQALRKRVSTDEKRHTGETFPFFFFWLDVTTWCLELWWFILWFQVQSSKCPKAKWKTENTWLLNDNVKPLNPPWNTSVLWTPYMQEIPCIYLKKYLKVPWIPYFLSLLEPNYFNWYKS